MNYGPLLFLATFFALAVSWFGFVLKPVYQLGFLQATNVVQGLAYPVARPGLAQQGLQVYRANGCAYCHSQQVGQQSTSLEVLVTDPGTNQAALLTALTSALPGLSPDQAARLLEDRSKPIHRGNDKRLADNIAKALSGAGGAKAMVSIVPAGPDIARGWGRRRTVAEDFLFDYPVMPGVQRAGPDLANVGLRLPDANWHLRHFYAPRAEVAGSTMPPYPFLFETRRIGRSPSPDALVLPKEYAAPEGYEVVPKPEARALAAYMLSLRADAPLFVTPMSVAAPAPAATNGTPAAAPTNSPPAAQ